MKPGEPCFFAPVWRHAREQGDVVAVYAGAQCWTWQQLAAAIEQQAEQWRDHGLQPGQRVMLCAADGPGHLLAALAVMTAGGVHIPVDHHLPASQLQAAQQAMQPDYWVTLSEQGHPRITPLTPTAAPTALPPESAFIRHTSGTTGSAKGVVLSHAAIAKRADAAIAALDLGAGDRLLWVLPLAYHFAVSVGACLRSGCAMVFAASMRARVTARLAREAAVTHAYISPWYAARLADPAVGDLGPALRQVLVTTAAIDALAADQLRQHLGVPVRQALGIIEVGLPLISPGQLAEPAGQLGPPAPGYQVRICNDKGEVLLAGHSGELCIAGPGLFTAYLDPWQPAETVLRDGYFATGDAACWDGEGRVQLLGRLKSVINVGGMKVFPLSVEAVLEAHPLVERARVRGIQDGPGLERVVADVQRAEDTLSPAEVIAKLGAHCAEHLTTLERPVAWHFGPLPVTPSGKVRR